MRSLWHAFWIDDGGQGLTEYVLIIALVSVLLILALGGLRDELGRLFDDANSEFEQGVSGSRAGAP